MNLHLYRYGEARLLPGLSLGVAHYLPRGVRRTDYVARGYFDLWLPLLAPSPKLVAAYKQKSIPFAVFARRYTTEMKKSQPRQTLHLVAAMALRQRVNLGCFCADAACCHRSVLRDLLVNAAAEIPSKENAVYRFASPACSMPEIED